MIADLDVRDRRAAVPGTCPGSDAAVRGAWTGNRRAKGRTMKAAIAALTLAAGLATWAESAAQPPASAPAAAAPASRPATIDEPFQATATKVTGTVLYALTGPDGKPGEFKPLKDGDRLPAGAVVQTRVRSKVLLSFGDDTVVLVDRVTMASIDQFHRSGDTKKIQLGLGHGLVRAAAVETTLRNDMTISNPVATLSKRGTLDFGMRYEPGTGHYVVFLNQEGLVELQDYLRNAGRSVQPGQYVTQALTRWIETLTLDRYIPIVDRWGTTYGEQHFNAYYGTGIAVVEPGAGVSNFFQNYHSSSQGAGLAGGQYIPVAPTFPLPSVPGGPLQVIRPEGNFGTGLRSQ
jgi:hypothetical protein